MLIGFDMVTDLASCHAIRFARILAVRPRNVMIRSGDTDYGPQSMLNDGTKWQVAVNTYMALPLYLSIQDGGTDVTIEHVISSVQLVIKSPGGMSKSRRGIFYCLFSYITISNWTRTYRTIVQEMLSANLRALDFKNGCDYGFDAKTRSRPNTAPFRWYSRGTVTHTHHETLSDRHSAPLDHNPQTLHALNYEPTTLNRKITFDIPPPDRPTEISPPPNDPETTDRDHRPLGTIPKKLRGFFDPLYRPATGHPPRASTTLH